MSRGGPESGGLVLRVDQKEWPGFKTEKQRKKNEMILKKCHLNACFYTKNPAF